MTSGVGALVSAHVALEEFDVVGKVREVLAESREVVVEHLHRVPAGELLAHDVRAHGAAAGD